MSKPNIKRGEKYITKQDCHKTRSKFGWNQNMDNEKGKIMTVSEVSYSYRKSSYFVRFNESSWTWHPDDIFPLNIEDIKEKTNPVFFDISEIAGEPNGP